MIPSSKFQSSNPLVKDRGPLCRRVSRAWLTLLSYDWAFFILCHIEELWGSMGVGLVARTEKNFESRRIRDWSTGSIPSLWSGLLDRASALLKEPGL